MTLPGGRREGFTFQPRRMSGFAGSVFGYHKPAFAPDAGVTSSLTVPDGLNIVLQQDANGNWNAVDGNGGTTVYNPDDPALGGVYSLTTKEGLAYQINAETRQVTQVVDVNGNTLTFTDTAVIHSSGQRVNIGRDPQGRITSITDPMGKVIRYVYDSSGDLISVTDRETNVTQFVYSPNRLHYLQQIIDPLGRTGVRTEYDVQGRLVNLVDATGNAVQLLHDPNNSTERVVDALGHTNAFVYDERGNVVAEVNAIGAVTLRAYDNNNFMTLEVDSLGNTNLFTYDGAAMCSHEPIPSATSLAIPINPSGPVAGLTSTVVVSPCCNPLLTRSVTRLATISTTVEILPRRPTRRATSRVTVMTDRATSLRSLTPPAIPQVLNTTAPDIC